MHRPAMRAGWLAVPLALAIVFATLFTTWQPASADTDLNVGGEARVSYTNGDSIRVRDEPSYSGSVITSVPEGWLVAVLDGPIDDGEGSQWYQVTARGQTGYMVSDYLARPGSSSGDSSSSGEVGIAAAATTTVALNLRSAASLSAAIILVMPRGASVQTTGSTQNGFSQLTYQGTTGWASSQYLSDGSSEPPPSGEVISNAWVVDGALNLRSGPSTSNSVILVMPGGSQVGVTGSPQNGFTPVRYNGTNGWAYSAYLSDSEPGDDDPPPPGEVISTAWVIDGSLNLRSGPSTSNSVLLVMPGGSEVGITGSPQNGFTPVRYNGTDGWVYSAYLTDEEPGDGEPEPPGEVIDTAWVIDGALNLRSGPSMADSVILVMPGGSEVSVTGSPQNGYTPVRYNGTDGWAYSQFLSDTEPGEEPEPGVEETRYTTADLNLRSGAGTSFGVLRVIPNGAAVTVTGGEQNGYVPVRYDGTTGYAAASYLTATDPGEEPPPSGGGLLVWPVRGGTWEIIQGYNGGTHQNRSETASYLYSLDIQNTAGAGATAGTAVYAPASGTVLWTNGGLLIGMGNGYGIAMFHITIDGSIGSGTEVTQGQYVGFISGPGGVGYQVTPHIDLTLWRLPNGGGSPRISTPFTGQFAISGLELPATGAWNTHGGTRFTP
jgi:mannosyl-glycoprotein endo-beta-N-acetylglucosaminidase